MTSVTVTLEEDPVTKELILPLPPELLAEAGWLTDDVLQFEALEGALTISNVPKATRDAALAEGEALFIVETVVSHRIRYAVRATTPEQAAAAALTDAVDEFDQNCLGEEVTLTRPVTLEQLYAEFGHIRAEHRENFIHDAPAKGLG